MPTGNRLGLDPEAVAGDSALELQGEEPVPGRGKHVCGHVGPCADVAGLVEGDIGLGPLVIRSGGGEFGRGVVQEVGVQVEFRGVTTCFGRCDAGWL